MDAEEAAAEEEAVEEATEETTEDDAIDETGNDSDVFEDQSISDATIEDEVASDEADSLNEAGEIEEASETEEAEVSEEADVLMDADGVGVQVTARKQTQLEYDGLVSKAQSADFKVADGEMTGTLYYKNAANSTTNEDGKKWVDAYGDGYFFIVNFIGLPAGVTDTQIEIGFCPKDADPRVKSNWIGKCNLEAGDAGEDGKGGLLKILNKNEHLFCVSTPINGTDYIDTYDLSKLTLAKVGTADTITLAGNTGDTGLKVHNVNGAAIDASTLQKSIKVNSDTSDGSVARSITGTLNYQTDVYGYTKNGNDYTDGYFMNLKYSVANDSNITHIGVSIYTKANELGEGLGKVEVVALSDHTAAHVIRVPNKETMLRVVGFTADPGTNPATVSAKGIINGVGANNVSYQALYDLSGLTLASTSAISSATVDAVSRKPGENSLIRVGDTVKFQISGKIQGASSTLPSLVVSATGYGFEDIQDQTASNLKISGTTWSAEVSTKAKTATARSDTGSAGAGIKVNSATFTLSGTNKSAEVGLGAVIRKLGVLDPTLAVAKLAITETSGMHNGTGYNDSTNPYGVGETVSSDTYASATYTTSTPTVESGFETIMAYKWTFMEPDATTSSTYYTFALSADDYVSHLPLPTISKIGKAKISVAARAYYAPSSALPESVKVNTAYTEDKLAALVDDQNYFEVQKDWTSATTAKELNVDDYSVEGIIAITPTNGQYRGSNYNELTGVIYGVGEDEANDTFVQVTYTTSASAKDANVVAYEWTWKEPSGSAVTYYTFALSDNNFRSNLVLPTITTAGNATVSARIKKYYVSGGTLPNTVKANTRYTEDKLLALVDGENVFARSVWGAGDDSTNVSKTVKVKNYSLLTRLELVGPTPTFYVNQETSLTRLTYVVPNPSGIEGLTWSVASGDATAIRIKDYDQSTGDATVVGVAESDDASIQYTATDKTGESKTVSLPVTVSENAFTVDWSNRVVNTHEGVGTIDLESIFADKSTTTGAFDVPLYPLSVRRTTGTAKTYSDTEVKGFSYAFSYPTGDAGDTAKELYSITNNQLTVLDDANGTARVNVTITCGDDGTTDIDYFMLNVEEKVVSSALVLDPENYTINYEDTEDAKSIYTGIADGSNVEFAITVPSAHSTYVKLDVRDDDGNASDDVHDYKVSELQLKLTSGAATHYAKDTTVEIPVKATQSFSDGTKATGSCTFTVYITMSDITLKGAKITETTKAGNKVVKADTTSTETYPTILLAKGDTVGRTLTAEALPSGYSVGGNWAWSWTTNGIVDVNTSGTNRNIATIVPKAAGTTQISAAPEGSSTIIAKFNVVVYDQPSAPVITLTNENKVSAIDADGYAVTTSGSDYNLSYTVDGTEKKAVEGYKLKVETKNTSQKSGDETFEPITLSEEVATTGAGTVSAKQFTADPVTIDYSLVLTNENDEVEDTVKTAKPLSILVDNIALDADPFSFSPNAITVEPNANATLSSSYTPTTATGVEYAWSIVDYAADHKDVADTTNNAAYAKIINDTENKKDVTVKGMIVGTHKVDLKLTYTQNRIVDKAKKETQGTKYTTITIASDILAASDIRLTVDGVAYDGATDYYLANNSQKSMTVAATVLPTSVENRNVEWKLDKTSFATIKEASDGKVYTGTEVTIVPKDGVEGVVTLTATTQGDGTPRSRSVKIYVSPVSLEKVEFAVTNPDKSYRVITTDAIQNGKSINVVALPWPRSAEFDASLTSWKVYGNKTSNAGANGNIIVANDGNSATITGAALGTDYVEVSMSDGKTTAKTETRLAVTVSNKAPEFATIEMNTGNETIMVDATLNLVAGYTPSGADTSVLVWKSSNPSVASVVANDEKTGAVVTGLAPGTTTISVTGNNVVAKCELTVNALTPDSVSISSVVEKGTTTPELMKTEGSTTYAIVPASSTVVISAKATKGTKDASNPNVRWYNGSTEITDAATAKGATSVEFATGAAGTVTELTGRAAADSSRTTSITIYTAPVLSEALVTEKLLTVNNGEPIADTPYTGSAVEPKLTLNFNGYTLAEGTDYKVDYTTDHTNAGAKVATVSAGTGKLFTSAAAGSELNRPYNITQIKLSDVVINLGPLTYTGYEQTPAIVSATYNNGQGSIPASELVIVSGRGTNAATYKAQFQTVSGTSAAANFEGTAEKEYTIDPAPISGVALSKTSFTYNGSKQVPTVSSATLKEGTDFDATIPTTSTNAGDYTVTVTGKGNYTGTETLKYTIAQAAISGAKLSKSSFTFNNAKQVPTVSVGSLKSNTDYKATFSNANSKNVGTYTVKVDGQGNYKGSQTLTYKITKASNPIKISKAKGSILVTKTVNVKSLVSKAQGSLTYATSDKKTATVTSKGVATGVKPGKATITVKAAGNANYKSGSVKYTLTVTKLAKPTNVKLTNSKKKQLGVSWKKVSNATGYRVLYSTKSNMKSAKTKDVKTTKATLTKLTSKKTYYVQVRAYVKKYTANNASDASSKVSKKVK
ncbi:MAG: Ig-like domain-containing protein [Lachnospiraceae bacterium]|nr:Ig-like domain-containing protein [Lachnospiraceae bacterium]